MQMSRLQRLFLFNEGKVRLFIVLPLLDIDPRRLAQIANIKEKRVV